MPLFPESAYQLELPKMYRVLQKFDTTQLENVEETVRAEMHKKEISSLVKPGMRIAMAVGSRGIQNLALIVKTIADELQNMGAMPFIVPAMGSHGGGTAKGQTAVLEGYGITEEAICLLYTSFACAVIMIILTAQGDLSERGGSSI